VVKVRFTLMGKRELPRGSVKQPAAEALFKVANPPTNHDGCYPANHSGIEKAALLYDRQESINIFKLVHSSCQILFVENEAIKRHIVKQKVRRSIGLVPCSKEQ
jgi:hypothetical protein